MARSFRLERRIPCTDEHDEPESEARRSARSERGATLVEYALLVAVFALPTAVAINYIRDVSKVKIEHTADGISERDVPGSGGD
ncbi:MAG: hypothetical protein KDB26_02665 [Microthrixaceae bacterium]|nr:hypothetical protein [Microthrixaceae bacterium]